MLKAKVSDILGIINKIAPPSLAENWDNVGLQVGDPAREVERIMVALDPGSQAIDAALETSCQLLLTHHPLIFKPLKKISTTDETGKLIHRAISGGLSIISAHTNYDSASSGVNDLLVEALGLTSCRPLKVVMREELVKLVVYVPETHLDQFMKALLPFSGLSEKYADCSFRVSGQGTFRPLAGADPFIGKVGTLENVAESRFEILVKKPELQQAIKALRKAHPYEEPAFDIIQLLNEGGCAGLGRVGTVEKPVSLKDFANLVKERLALSSLRVVGDPERRISKVALCGGSGSSLLRDAVREGADLLLTGDVKYHDARDAQALGIALLDAGHFATERLMIRGLSIQLQEECAKRRFEVEILQCAAEIDPFEVI
jgi:dinuclear metal center YbgI/SA1388 family protein